MQVIVGGAMNVVRQGTAQGVKRIIVTGTVLSMLDVAKLEETFTDRVLSEKGMSLTVSMTSKIADQKRGVHDCQT